MAPFPSNPRGIVAGSSARVSFVFEMVPSVSGPTGIVNHARSRSCNDRAGSRGTFGRARAAAGRPTFGSCQRCFEGARESAFRGAATLCPLEP